MEDDDQFYNYFDNIEDVLGFIESNNDLKYILNEL